MRVKVTTIGEGSHPNEVMVTLNTISGPEKLVVHQRSLKENGLDVGYPINRDDNNYLVELPRETITGAWRVWVSERALSE